jgi:hypothetical protein
MQITLISGGRTDYAIYLCEDPSPSQLYAAKELSDTLYNMTGARLGIAGPAENPPEKAVCIGINGGETFGDEDFHILTIGDTLFIRGGKARGCLYGVYEFLERVCGCRWFAPDCTHIPQKTELTVPMLDFAAGPAFSYREVFYKHCFDGDFAARARLNGSHMRLEDRHGGKVRYARGYFVHTFSRLVPPETYYGQHPEYFALRNGVRERDNAQLCLSNPEVLEIAAEKAISELRSQPDAKRISISQNDGSLPCTCPACRAIAEEEGSESGPILRFVNSIAERIEREFPDVLVDTLAYDYSRKPPRLTRPRRNVIIRLCSFECCFSHPLDGCREIADAKKRGTPPEFADFAGDVEKWSRIANRLFIWDYVTDFEFYQHPHPNLHVLAPNIRFFAANNVEGVFEQGNGQSPNGEMAELRAYLLSRLLWDKDADVTACTEEFLNAWFGPAAEAMRAYLSLAKSAVLQSGYHLSLYDHPAAPYITPAFLSEADSLFDAAENSVSDDTELLRRVKKERLGIRFAWFFHLAPDDNRSREVEQYIEDSKALGVLRFSEKWGTENIRRLAMRGVWPPLEKDMEVIRD